MTTKKWREKLVHKKLLSGIMSAVILAGSGLTFGAQSPNEIKNFQNSSSKIKKIALKGVIGAAAVGGIIMYVSERNTDIKMDFNDFDNMPEFWSKLLNAVKSFKSTLTVSNISAGHASLFHTKIMNASPEKIEGIEELGEEVQGTLVLEKTKKEDGTIKITFKFEEEKKAEEKKEETNVNPEDGVNKEENKKAETEVNEEDNKDEENHDVEASKDFELKILELGKNMCYEKQKEIIEGITKIKNRSDESNKAYESVENSIKKFFNAFNNEGPFEQQEAYIEYLAALEDAQRLL